MRSVEEARAFQKSLLETGSYRTDPAHPVSALGRSDAWFYLRFLHFLWEGSRACAAGTYTEPIWAAHSFTYMKIVEDSGGKIDITGFEHPAGVGRTCVYIGNHMSGLEGFVIPVILQTLDRVAAVAKESLLHYPLLGAITRAIDPIAVRRENPREDLKTVLEEGKRYLDNGRSIVLFPQATRSARFDRKAFNSLGVKLAKSANAPVVPLALKTDFLKNGRWIKDLGALDRTRKIHFRFGKPLTIEGNGKAANEAVMDFIEACLAEWTAEDAAGIDPNIKETTHG